MSKKKKYILIIAAGGIVALLGLLILLTGQFIFDVAFHAFTRLLCTCAVVWVIRKSFKEDISHVMNKVSVLCGAVIAVDLVMVDVVRYVLSHGESVVLFLPACVPLSFMIIMHYTFKEKRDRLFPFLIGILLLALSLYFEVLSFMDIVLN